MNGDVYNYDERELDSDYFTQPGLLWRVMSAEDRKATCENTARAMGDAERDIRGFAMKFYTDAGNWDLVGNNTPVFFLRDPLK